MDRAIRANHTTVNCPQLRSGADANPLLTGTSSWHEQGRPETVRTHVRPISAETVKQVCHKGTAKGVDRCAPVQSRAGIELDDTNDEQMSQHPRVTVEWALHGLEVAIRNLGDGTAEQRVRRQFHQVLLAVEREARRIDARSGLIADDLREEAPAQEP
jgi:hypothetical protein